MKERTFDFDRIKLLFLKSKKEEFRQVISEDVCSDLDFEELFMYIDHTHSKPGQQLLYKYLRTIPFRKDRAILLEKNIRNITAEKQEIIVKILSRLDQPGSYYLPSVFHDEHLKKPTWYPIIPALSITTLVSAMLSFFYPVALFALLGIVLVNSFIHFWNKGNVLSYTNALPQLQLLKLVSQKLHRVETIIESQSALKSSIKKLNSISRKASVLQLENNIRGEIGQILDYLFDLIKIIFLIEPLTIFSIQEELVEKRSDVERLFMFVAEIDVALSIQNFRNTIPHYTIPDLSNEHKTATAVQLYHPLVSNPIFNDLSTKKDHSVLISGSNMSGKTTFIRAVGINILLGQTINTVCAKNLKSPTYLLYSAIRINDNLLNDDSYYFKEVKVIKKMIDAADTGSKTLFLLDELFKGTNTRERVAAGKAVLSYLNKNNNLVVAATHDLELTEMLSDSYEFYHFSDFIEKDQLVFDYKLKKGVLSNTNAIKILLLNDYPTEIVKEAMEIATKS